MSIEILFIDKQTDVMKKALDDWFSNSHDEGE